MERETFGWRLELTTTDNKKKEKEKEKEKEKSKNIFANLLVGADGKFSKVREQANIETITKDYHQTALVFTIKHELSHENYAFEHFMHEGPLAFLPINTHMSAVVWTMSHDKANTIKGLSNENICIELEKAFGGALGHLEIITKIWSYPLSIVMAKSMARNRVVLIGDAAHGIHPVAGQGLNLGIKDIKDFVKKIGSSFELGLDIGSDSVIRAYGRQRRLDVASISGSSHSIIRLFSNNIKPVKLLRDTGLRMVNSSPTLKKFFMRKAMGI